MIRKGTAEKKGNNGFLENRGGKKLQITVLYLCSGTKGDKKVSSVEHLLTSGSVVHLCQGNRPAHSEERERGS